MPSNITWSSYFVKPCFKPVHCLSVTNRRRLATGICVSAVSRPLTLFPPKVRCGFWEMYFCLSTTASLTEDRTESGLPGLNTPLNDEYLCWALNALPWPPSILKILNLWQYSTVTVRYGQNDEIVISFCALSINRPTFYLNKKSEHLPLLLMFLKQPKFTPRLRCLLLYTLSYYNKDCNLLFDH